MPNRILREGILTSLVVNAIADRPAVEVTYRRLYSVADDFGRYPAHPCILRAALYPLRIDKITEAEISDHLKACEAAGLIRLYEAGGKAFLEVLNFNQRTRARQSKYPEPDGSDSRADDGSVRTNDRKARADGSEMRADDGSARANSRDVRTETETYFGGGDGIGGGRGDDGARTDFDAPNLWEEFQNAYPEPKRLVKVEPGCRAYTGRIHGKPGEHQMLMAGLQRYLASDQWRRSLEQDGGRFVPSMESFIANGVYLDSPPAFRPDGPKVDGVSAAINQAMSQFRKDNGE